MTKIPRTPEPDEVVLGNCCPDEPTPQEQRIVDPHLPERDEAVAIAQSIYGVAPPTHLPVRWIGRLTVEKYRGAPVGTPYEVIESTPNLLLDDGIEFLLDRIIGTSGTSFSNANAHIAVGTGTTTPDNDDTDLAGTSHREPMDATFPSRAAQTMTFKSTFETGDANFHWQEWGLANAVSGALLLNRSLQDFGTKTSSESWVATLTVTMSG